MKKKRTKTDLFLKKELANIKKQVSSLNRKISSLLEFSIGNKGVQTDRQQTDTGKKVFELVERLKSDLKEKFKSLTRQEFYIFSLIYTMEEQEEVNYKKLAKRASLTQSSIRDYIARLLDKEIPIKKEKINNQQVILRIAPELRNISTLNQLVKIREKRSLFPS